MCASIYKHDEIINAIIGAGTVLSAAIAGESRNMCAHTDRARHGMNKFASFLRARRRYMRNVFRIF